MTDQAPGQAGLSRNAFVGRERELAELRAALEDAGDSPCHLFLISGEPGIGKTRLVDELAAHARARGIRVVWGRCWEGGGAPAYWPWIQIIRAALTALEPEQRRALLESEVTPHIAHYVAQIVPDLRPLSLEAPKPSPSAQLDPDQARFRLFDSVTNLLKNFVRFEAMLIVLDDLHDADQASLMMLRFIARQLKGAGPLVIVGTYRDVEVRRSAILGKLVGDLSAEARSIPLAGLSEAEVARFVESIGGRTPDAELVSRVYAATDGNPLFVDGIVRMLTAEEIAGRGRVFDRSFKIPDGVREAIRLRLAALSEQPNSILSVAAVIGNEFEAGRCRSVAGVSPDEIHRLLDEASDASIVTPLGYGRYRFSHALIRAVLYDEIDTNSRIRLHTRVGEVMEEIYRDDPRRPLAELAHHFRAAGIADKAIDYLIRAGQAGEAVFAYEEAARLYTTAIDAIRLREPVDRAMELEVLLALASVHFYAGSFPSSKLAFAQAAEVARDLQAWRSFARAVLGLAGEPQDALLRHQDSKLVALVEEALARHRVDDALRSMLLARLAVEAHLRAEGSGRVESLFQQAINLARQIGDRNALFNALNSRAFFRVFDPGDEDLTELATIGRDAPEPDASWLGFAWEFRRHLTMGNVQALEASIEGYARAAEQSRLPGSRSVLAAVRGMRALMEGKLQEGEQLCEDALHILEPWERYDPGQMFPLILALRREQGRLDEISSLVRRGVQLFPSFPFVHVNLAQLLLETGREADARIEFERLASNDFRDIPRDTNWLATVIQLADVCARVRDAQRARILYALLLPYAEQNAHFLILACYGSVSHYLGTLAATLSRYEEAEKHFQSALDFNARMKASLLTAYTQRDYASMLLERGAPGDHQKALALVSDTSRTAAALGLKRLAAELKTLQVQCEVSAGSQSPRVGSRNGSTEPRVRSEVPEQSADHVFRREGDFWTIAYRGTTSRLRDAKGLRYLAFLLAHPGERFHVHDLVTVVEGGAAPPRSKGISAASGRAANIESVRDLGDAGTALDPRARAEYRRRRAELYAELDEAEQFNDLARTERIRAEIELLDAELSAAAGLGGRGRKAAAHAERARGMVGKNIRTTVARIRLQNPLLGHHLANSIRTGYFCAYFPEPDSKIFWQL